MLIIQGTPKLQEEIKIVRYTHKEVNDAFAPRGRILTMTKLTTDHHYLRLGRLKKIKDEGYYSQDPRARPIHPRWDFSAGNSQFRRLTCRMSSSMENLDKGAQPRPALRL
jgi:hypothetical protein